jgi:3-mercaptopyruvate sulfurtransferase SseA
VRVRLPEFLAATGDPRNNVMLEALQPTYFYGGAAFFNRGGHVPHATLMPSEDFYNTDKTFKSPQEIQRMLDHLGIKREQQVLTYCGGGGAAAVPFFALKFMLGYPRVKMFQESQMGWLQDERELPVWTYGDPHLTRDTAWLKAWANPMLKAFGLSRVSIVDVRAADAFQLGHVPLAVNLPALAFSSHRQSPATLATLLGQAGVDPSHEAVVVSEGGLNESSALAFLLLESLGQQKVSIFMDSTERWAELGQEVVRPAAAAAASKPSGPSAMPASPAAPYAAVARTGLLVSDPARSQGLYPKVYVASGPALPTRAPEGRVLHLPYTQFLNADGTPKAAKEIWNTLAKAGVQRYAEIVVFADTLGEAAVNYVILRMMGFADVKVLAPKGSFTNKMITSVWSYGVVPLAVKRIEFELDRGEVGVADDQALGVRVGVDLGAHLQSAARLGVGNQLDDHLVTDQRTTAPVHRDEREQTVLDLVPLAGARREVAYANA